MATRRDARSITVTIASGGALSEAVDFEEFAGGIILMPAAWTAASIGFHVATGSGETFYPLYDSDGTLVQVSSPTADNAYSIPSEVYGAQWFKLWSQDGAASDENQGADRAVAMVLKS